MCCAWRRIQPTYTNTHTYIHIHAYKQAAQSSLHCLLLSCLTLPFGHHLLSRVISQDYRKGSIDIVVKSPTSLPTSSSSTLSSFVVFYTLFYLAISKRHHKWLCVHRYLRCVYTARSSICHHVYIVANRSYLLGHKLALHLVAVTSCVCVCA